MGLMDLGGAEKREEQTIRFQGKEYPMRVTVGVVRRVMPLLAAIKSDDKRPEMFDDLAQVIEELVPGLPVNDLSVRQMSQVIAGVTEMIQDGLPKKKGKGVAG